jgi:hypothetical protein
MLGPRFENYVRVCEHITLAIICILSFLAWRWKLWADVEEATAIRVTGTLGFSNCRDDSGVSDVQRHDVPSIRR